MWYKVIATFEDGKVLHYEVKGYMEVLKRVAWLKEKSHHIYCKNRMVNYKIEKEGKVIKDETETY